MTKSVITAVLGIGRDDLLFVRCFGMTIWVSELQEGWVWDEWSHLHVPRSGLLLLILSCEICRPSSTEPATILQKRWPLLSFLKGALASNRCRGGERRSPQETSRMWQM